MNEAFLNYEGLNLTQATAIQSGLRAGIKIEPLQKPVLTVAGADISHNQFNNNIFAGIVLLRYSDLQPVGYSLVRSETRFPYVHGFLAFREVPALVQALAQIPVQPDVIMIDGHGIAHPRGLGIAAHFGALTKMATMGCAKKILLANGRSPVIRKVIMLKYKIRDKKLALLYGQNLRRNQYSSLLEIR